MVEILDVVLVVWERQAPLPTSGDDDRLITDLKQPARCVHCVVCRLAALAVVLQRVTGELGRLIHRSKIGTGSEPRHVTYARQDVLAFVIVIFPVHNRKEVDFTASHKVASSSSSFQRVLTPLLESQCDTLLFWNVKSNEMSLKWSKHVSCPIPRLVLFTWCTVEFQRNGQIFLSLFFANVSLSPWFNPEQWTSLNRLVYILQ